MIWFLNFIVTQQIEKMSFVHSKLREQYHFRFCLKEVFQFAEHQKNSIDGSGYKLIRKSVIDAKVKVQGLRAASSADVL